MDIIHDNIVYIRDFSEIGGVETFTYEMIKKYKDKDIAVVYKNAHQSQINRVRKYCRAYQHTNQNIICKVAIINYDISIIDFINEDAKIYQVVHGDYENPAYTWKPPTHERITQYIGVTKHICESFKRITGLENVTYSYNPLTIDNEQCLTLISMTRLSRIKGRDRMVKLAETLDNYGINYIWYVFTDDTKEIQRPNVYFMKNRLDVWKWLINADYLVQLSDTEACSYAINEALYRNIPVIVTPLPYLEEIGVKDNENAYILNFDCSNVEDIAKKIMNKPKFEFKHLEDGYNRILAKGKSRYKEEKRMKARVRALQKFEGIRDAERDVYPKAGEEWITNLERAEYLKSNGAVEILEEIREEPQVIEPVDNEPEQLKEKKPKKIATRKKKIDTKK